MYNIPQFAQICLECYLIIKLFKYTLKNVDSICKYDMITCTAGLQVNLKEPFEYNFVSGFI